MEITKQGAVVTRPDALAADAKRKSQSAGVVAAWLLVCCAMLFAMIVVGGVTRLTHSGLSITEWQPIVGTLPPLSAQDWNDAFAKYQATPEYLQINRGMDLEAFKRIFWWEYVHRLLGRAIGIVFIVPLLWFIARRRIPPGYGPALATLFVLGGAQGALGWYMVQSGLVDDPRVSQLRLTAHLGLAIAIFGAMWWIALSLLRPSALADTRRSSLRPFAIGIVGVVFVMVLSGGLVAGIRAGFAYNTFPRMNGEWMPSEIMMIQPWYRNFYENMATVQFDHRLIALLLALLVTVYWWRTRDALPPARRSATLLIAMLAMQVALGISTLLLVVPVGLAALHQAGAVLVFAAAINAAHAVRGTA